MTHPDNKFITAISKPGRTYDEHIKYIADTTGRRMKPLNKDEEDILFLIVFLGLIFSRVLLSQESLP